MLRLFTDTDCDVTPEVAREYGYELISMPYSIDGKTVYPYVDFEKFDSKGFYDTLRAGALPNTSAISRQGRRHTLRAFLPRDDRDLRRHGQGRGGA